MHSSIRLFALPFVIAIGLPFCLHAQTKHWSHFGPDGGHITCLSISPSNPDILFAGSEVGIFKSEDGGDSWKRTNFPDFYEVRSILVHSTDPDRIMAGTYRCGLYSTLDGGQTWTYRGLWDQTINSLDRDPNDPGIIYFTTGESMSNPENEFITLYRIFDDWDQGESMIDWDTWGECGWCQANQVLADPDSTNILYAAGTSSGYCSSFGAFLISKDTGSSWTDKEIPFTSGDDASRIALTKTSIGEKCLFASCGGSPLSFQNQLFRSPDMGENWSEVELPHDGTLNPFILMTHPSDSAILVVGFNCPERPLWLYDVEEDSWDFLLGSGLPPVISPPCAVAEGQDQVKWYLPATYGGLYRSTGTEGRWDQVNTGMDNCAISDFQVHPDHPQEVYAATYSSLKLLKSTDAGKNWATQPGNLSASFDVLAIDPNQPSNFWAAKSGYSYYRLYKGENYGQNWTGPVSFLSSSPSSNRTEISDILVKPGDSENIALSSQPRIVNGSLSGFGLVARSTDGGQNWSNYAIPGSCLAYDPEDLDKLYVGKERAGQVFLLETSGNTTLMSSIEPEDGMEDVRDMIVDKQGNLFVATEDGLWKKNNSGWIRINSLSDEITSLAADHRQSPSAIYAGAEYDGVMVSFDSGESWMPFNNGLSNTKIEKLRISNDYLYASVPYGGIWSIQLEDAPSAPFLTHTGGKLKVSVFQDGAFGHAAPNNKYGEGVVFDQQPDALFYGGLILGTSQRSFVNGHLGSFWISNDFQTSKVIEGFYSLPGQWEQISGAVFDDSSAPSPLGIQVTQHAFSNTDEDFLILRYRINCQDGNLEDVFAGIFADWDVGGGAYCYQNLGGLDQDRNMAYMYLDGGDPDPSYYGIVALNEMSGVRISASGHPLTIRETSFEAISEMDEELPEEPDELKMWIGTGPFKLSAGESVEVAFAVVAGSHLGELQSNADLAIEKYPQTQQFTSVGMNELPGYRLDQNVPNPFHEETMLSFSIPKTGDASLRVYDAQGTMIKLLEFKGLIAGEHTVRIHPENWEPGLYLYQFRSGKFYDSKTMLIR